jgi:hypothetical protein
MQPSYYLTFIFLASVYNKSIIHNLSFYDSETDNTAFYKEIKDFLHISKSNSFIGTPVI